jgi:hypothetical protein
VQVRERHSTVHPSEVTGYAVGLPGHTARDGGVVWYGGGKLAADLTLPKLRARWTGAGPGHVPWNGTGVPPSAVRGTLRTLVTHAAEQSTDETGFFARLRETGVLVRVRLSEIDPGQVTGYSVTLPGRTGPDGTLLWYGGGRLAAGLTLPRLRDHWNRAPGRGAERSGAAVHRSGTGRGLPARGTPSQGRRRAHPSLRHGRSGRSGRCCLSRSGYAACRGAGAAQPAPAVRSRLLRPRGPCPVRAAAPAQPRRRPVTPHRPDNRPGREPDW